MRPRKVILCVSSNEQELSVMSFMLDTKGYRVMPMTSGDEALMVFAGTLARGGVIDLVLTDYTMSPMNGNDLVVRLKQIAGHIPMILLGDPQKMVGMIHSADALLDKFRCPTDELLERIKIMSARKRGPRKGTPCPPRSVSAAEILARESA